MKVSFAILLLLGVITLRDHVGAITEDPNEVTMRDVGASKERPPLDGYDVDADT